MLGTPELVVIFLIIMLVYGGARMPAVGRGLGQSVREFREGLRGDTASKSPTASQDAHNASDGPSDTNKDSQI